MFYFILFLNTYFCYSENNISFQFLLYFILFLEEIFLVHERWRQMSILTLEFLLPFSSLSFRVIVTVHFVDGVDFNIFSLSFFFTFFFLYLFFMRDYRHSQLNTFLSFFFRRNNVS